MKLFINEALTEPAKAALEKEGIIFDKLEEATIAWVRLRDMIDPPWLDRAPHLRYIVTATTGLNHIDLEACEQRGIKVLSLQGETEFLQGITATAEHTIALMLALLRRIPESFDSVRSGSWERFVGRELAEQDVCIIGFGRIGKQLTELLNAFGVIPGEVDGDAWWDGGRQDYRIADIVTLHANYMPENRLMCDAAFFASLKPGALFINTARGELVGEAALLDALESGHLGGAALDVLSDETELNIPDVRCGECDRLIGHRRKLIEYSSYRRNLIITPHSGGATVESMQATELFMVDKLLALT